MVFLRTCLDGTQRPLVDELAMTNGSNGAATTDNTPVINALADMAVQRAVQVLSGAQAALLSVSAASEEPLRADATSEDGRPSKRRRKPVRESVPEVASGSSRSGNKGLRHFGSKVCEEVQAQGRTTYNVVADKLVDELSREGSLVGAQYDEKNIRRRVYDAINVLMATGIIAKEKKDMIWKGFPQLTATHKEKLRVEREQVLGTVESKAAYVQELVEKQQALSYLLERHKDTRTAQHKQQEQDEQRTKLHVPFIVIQAKQAKHGAEVVVKVSDDMLDVHFEFSNSPFQIHDDGYVLRHLAKRNGGTVPADGVASAAQAAAGETPASTPQQLQLQQAGPSGTSHNVKMELDLASPMQQGSLKQRHQVAETPQSVVPPLTRPQRASRRAVTTNAATPTNGCASAPPAAGAQGILSTPPPKAAPVNGSVGASGGGSTLPQPQACPSAAVGRSCRPAATPATK